MRVCFTLCLLLLMTTMSHGNEVWQKSALNQVIKNGELRVGLEPGYAPFEMVAKDQSLIGFDVDIARAMAKAMGVKLKLVKLEWSGILPALLTNQCDIIMSGMTITPERNLYINFADSYLTVGQTFLLRKALRRKVKSIKDLNNAKYTVTTKPGTTALKAIKTLLPKARVQLKESEWDAVKKSSRVVPMRCYDLPFNAVAYARNKGAVIFRSKPFTHERLGWGIRKGTPTFNWLNHFLAQMKGDGTFDALYAVVQINGLTDQIQAPDRWPLGSHRPGSRHSKRRGPANAITLEPANFDGFA